MTDPKEDKQGCNESLRRQVVSCIKNILKLLQGRNIIFGDIN